MKTTWNPPGHWQRVTAIDAHTAGEPLRVILEGFPEPPGRTMLEKRRHARERFDALRRTLMWEPRGHADMYGCLLTSPVTPDGDVGVLFLHNEGYSTMCGHGIIGLVTVGLECGLLRATGSEPEVRIDTPAGRVTARACMKDGRVVRVSFLNVPSFLLHRDLTVEVPGLGRIRCDIAFGGAFYAYVDAGAAGVKVRPEECARIIDAGMKIKRAVAAAVDLRHPEGDEELNFLYGVIFVEMLGGEGHSRNVCVFAEGEVDRSPTGTGVSGRAAIHHARGELGAGVPITIESILGTVFQVEVAEEATVGNVPAVIPRVSGRAFITGRSEFFADPEDPLKEGFLLR